MKRLGLIAALALTLVGLSAGAAVAVTNFDNAPSGAHYRKGSAEPVCTESTVPTTGAITVSCTGTTIGGVGNTNADLLLSVTGTANFVCHNPGNDNIVEPHSASVNEYSQRNSCPIEERPAGRSCAVGHDLTGGRGGAIYMPQRELEGRIHRLQ